MLHLLMTRRFAPLFATQFLGAFNDNLFKTSMLFLITYHLMGDDVQAGATLVMLAGGVFILPFFLFSGMAGQLADSRDKAWVIRMVKTAEVAIMAVGAWALMSDSIAFLMLVLFAMGIHSAFFGPVKYAILPQHLAAGEVLAGTGLVEAGTFIAILCGQIMGGLLSAPFAAMAVLGVAVLGWIAGRAVPAALSLSRSRSVLIRPWRSTVDVLRDLRADRDLLCIVLAISWFWAIGAVLTSQFVPLVKGLLHAKASVASLFLALFSIGIALGTLSANMLRRGQTLMRPPLWAGVGMSICLFFLDFSIGAYAATKMPGLRGVADFLVSTQARFILAAFFSLSWLAGVGIVPLYAILQTASTPDTRARMVAANNIVNAGFMVVATFGASMLLAFNVSLSVLLLLLAGMNLFVTFFLYFSTRKNHNIFT